MKICPECNLNPNDQQSKEQQQWESEFILENGICSACQQEKKNDKKN